MLLIYLGLFSMLNAEDLLSKYKQKVTDAHAQEEVNKKDYLSAKLAEENILEDIRNIKKMKQDTFEATADFIKRRNSEIQKLEENASFYAKSGDKKFSFGSIAMKSYDADTQRMLLSVKWNEGVYKLFPELKRVHTAYLDIVRDQARELFEEKKIHNFHIKMEYRGERLIVTSMSLYDKYRFYAKVKRKVVVPKVVERTYEPVYEDAVTSCDYYYINATSVNIRSRSTTRSVKSGRLSKNKKVCVTKKRGSWYYIKSKGWVLNKYLQKTKVTKRKKQVKRDRSVWHCTARSVRASGWVERVGKENAKRGALQQCTMRLQTNTPCRITNCYRL